MEFWGVEVKAGQRLKVHPGFDKVLHLSQAALGGSKKGKGEDESVPLFLNVDGQKLVIGTLNTDKCRQIAYDLVFVEEFELSHTWANGSVYFTGYKSLYQENSDDDDDSSDDECSSEELEDDITLQENVGIPEQKDVPSTPSTDDAAKPKVKVVEPIKEVNEMEVDSDSDDEEDDSEDDSKSKVKVVEPIKDEKVKDEDTDSDDDDDEDDSEDDDEDKSAEEMNDSSDDEDDDSSDDEDEDESSEEEDEATPKKAVQNKKRHAPPAESDTKTPTGKKAKLVTPQKPGGEGKKTGGHVATPYPSKQASKTSANKDKSKQQTPASDGQVSCGSCSRSFKSEQARDSHSKAKHGPAK